MTAPKNVTQQATSYTPTDALVRLLARAAVINKGYEQDFDLSFSSLLLAFLASNDPLSRWFQAYVVSASIPLDAILSARNMSRATLDEVAQRSFSPQELGQPWRTTSSARDFLATANQYRIQTARSDPAMPLDVRHLMAVYIYEPRGHEEDIRKWNFNRFDWSNNFLSWIAGNYPAEVDIWKQIHIENLTDPPVITPISTTEQSGTASDGTTAGPTSAGNVASQTPATQTPLDSGTATQTKSQAPPDQSGAASGSAGAGSTSPGNIASQTTEAQATAGSSTATQTTPQAPPESVFLKTPKGGGILADPEQFLQDADRVHFPPDSNFAGSDALIFWLALEPDAPASAFLAAAGLSFQQVSDSLQTRFRWARTPDEIVPIPPPLSSPLQTSANAPSGLASSDLPPIRAHAEEIAKAKNRPMRTRDLFVAILETPQCAAYGWLAETFDARQIPIEWVKRTVNGWAEEHPFTVDVVQARIDVESPSVARSAFSDTASHVDRLNFGLQAGALAEMILKRETLPPVVVGVYGPWGSGKSTFMNLVQDELTKRSAASVTKAGQRGWAAWQSWLGAAVRSVWLAARNTLALNRKKSRDALKAEPLPELLCVNYNAWAFTDAAKLWAGLVRLVCRRLDDSMTPWQRVQYAYERHRARLFAALALGVLSLLLMAASLLWTEVGAILQNPAAEAAARIIGLVASVFGFNRLWAARPLAHTVDALTRNFDASRMNGVMNQVRDEIHSVVENYFAPQPDASEPEGRVKDTIHQGKLKLVVFIDEVDRCPLHRIVDILEAIKLFLDEGIFIVLIAVDTRVAAEVVRLNYKDVTDLELAHEYLEKIEQIPLQVPKADGRKILDYVDSLMPGAAAVQAPAQTRALTQGDGQRADAGLTAGATAGISGPQPEGLQPGGQSTQTSNAIVTPPGAVTWQARELRDTQDERNTIASLSALFLDSNPRRIKRLLNTYRYVKILAKRLGINVSEPTWQKRIIAWLVFTLVWPAFMRKAIHAAEDPLLVDSPLFLYECIQKFPTTVHAANGIELTQAIVLQHLNLRAAEVRALGELAGNFLIEGAPTA